MKDDLKLMYMLSLSTHNTVVFKHHFYNGSKVKGLTLKHLLGVQIYKAYTRKLFKDQWCTYILELKDATYYTGIAKNLEARLNTHIAGKGSKYVRSRLPFNILYIEFAENRSQASQLEYHIKKLPKRDKHLLRMNEKDNTKLLGCGCGLVIRIPDNIELQNNIICYSCNSIIETEENEY